MSYSSVPVNSDDSNPFAGKSNSNAPAWLSDARENASTNPINSSSNSNAQQDPQHGEEDPNVPRMIFYTRIINLVLSVLMVITSLLSLMTTVEATTGVLACYVIVLSCLLCCYETHLKQVSKVIALNFGFLYSAKSRCIFMIFVGTILFSFSLFGKIIGIAMLLNAGFNIYILVKHPTFEDAQRRDAQAEIEDFLAANPAFAKQALAIGVRAGANAAARNPDLVRQGAEAWMGANNATSGTV